MIPENTRQWADRVARCATSCAATIETRKIKAHEAPLVLGALVRGLSDHTGVPIEKLVDMVHRAALALELPEKPPELKVPQPSDTLIARMMRHESQIKNLSWALRGAIDALKAARDHGCEIRLDLEIAKAEAWLPSDGPSCANGGKL